MSTEKREEISVQDFLNETTTTKSSTTFISLLFQTDVFQKNLQQLRVDRPGSKLSTRGNKLGRN